jgi:hypothetical protein
LLLSLLSLRERRLLCPEVGVMTALRVWCRKYPGVEDPHEQLVQRLDVAIGTFSLTGSETGRGEDAENRSRIVSGRGTSISSPISSLTSRWKKEDADIETHLFRRPQASCRDPF